MPGGALGNRMEFICVQCGRKDEVIGDKKPRCLHCGAALLKATESYAGLWMSPEFVLKRMQTIVEKHGFQEAASGRFKHEREAWTSALYALALTQMHNKRLWVEVETVEQTPDTRVHHINQDLGHNRIESQNIEVVDWEVHVDDPMVLVNAKCKKAYPHDYCLLITARSGKMTYPQAIAREIRDISVPFAEIWLVGLSAYNTAHVTRLHPSVLPWEVQIFEAVKRARTEMDVLCKRQRGTSTEFIPTGPIYLPIP